MQSAAEVAVTAKQASTRNGISTILGHHLVLEVEHSNNNWHWGKILETAAWVSGLLELNKVVCLAPDTHDPA